MKLESFVDEMVAQMQGSGQVPQGFEQIPSEPFSDLSGPIYRRPDGNGGWIVGFLAEARHANASGSVHGGMLATLCDYALGANAAERCGSDQSVSTITLNIDYVGAGRVGEWIEAETTMDKESGRLKFANCIVRGQCGRALLRSSGVFSSYTLKG